MIYFQLQWYCVVVLNTDFGEKSVVSSFTWKAKIKHSCGKNVHFGSQSHFAVRFNPIFWKETEGGLHFGVLSVWRKNWAKKYLWRKDDKKSDMGKNLKKWKMWKMYILWYLCQNSFICEFNTPHIVKVDSGLVLFSSFFPFQLTLRLKKSFCVFWQFCRKKVV